jgi:hypothetical protein
MFTTEDTEKCGRGSAERKTRTISSSRAFLEAVARSLRCEPAKGAGSPVGMTTRRSGNGLDGVGIETRLSRTEVCK